MVKVHSYCFIFMIFETRKNYRFFQRYQHRINFNDILTDGCRRALLTFLHCFQRDSEDLKYAHSSSTSELGSNSEGSAGAQQLIDDVRAYRLASVSHNTIILDLDKKAKLGHWAPHKFNDSGTSPKLTQPLFASHGQVGFGGGCRREVDVLHQYSNKMSAAGNPSRDRKIESTPAPIDDFFSIF